MRALVGKVGFRVGVSCPWIWPSRPLGGTFYVQGPPPLEPTLPKRTDWGKWNLPRIPERAHVGGNMNAKTPVKTGAVCKDLFQEEPLGRFELPTCALRMRCSTAELKWLGCISRWKWTANIMIFSEVRCKFADIFVKYES